MVIAITNQKGGVGKSTTAVNLSACLAKKGASVLALDMDPQGNMSSGLGIDKAAVQRNIYDVIIGETTLKDAVTGTRYENLSIVSSTEDLAGAEIELLDADNRETRLKRALNRIKKNYDYVIIDCPPSLSLLTINSLTAAEGIIIPIQCEYYALEGLTQMLHTVDLIKERLNPKLEIEGILFTMFDSRTNLSIEVVESVRDNVDIKIFKTIIPRNVKLAEAPSYGMAISEYDSASAGAEAYEMLADELMKGKVANGKKKWPWQRLGLLDSK